MKAHKTTLSVRELQKTIGQWKSRKITDSTIAKLLELMLGMTAYMNEDAVYPVENFYDISKADVTALLDEYADAVPGDDDTKRVLDLVKVPAEDRADLVVLNTDEAWTVNPERFHSSARNTPFGGWQVTGRPLATIIGSKLVFSRINKED